VRCFNRKDFLYLLALLIRVKSAGHLFSKDHHDDSTAQHSTAQHSTAQHSTAQHSTAQHSLLNLSLNCKKFFK